MTRKVALILVLLAMLPQLVLGMGSGRVLEICFCGPTGAHPTAQADHCHEHSDAHTHHHHHADPAAPEDDHAPGGSCGCDESPSGTCHPCSHVVVAGQVGRFEPVQTWNYFAILDALSCICVETIADDGRTHLQAPRADAKPPGDVLFATRTTSFQI